MLRTLLPLRLAAILLVFGSHGLSDQVIQMEGNELVRLDGEGDYDQWIIEHNSWLTLIPPTAVITLKDGTRATEFSQYHQGTRFELKQMEHLEGEVRLVFDFSTDEASAVELAYWIGPEGNAQCGLVFPREVVFLAESGSSRASLDIEAPVVYTHHWAHHDTVLPLLNEGDAARVQITLTLVEGKTWDQVSFGDTIQYNARMTVDFGEPMPDATESEWSGIVDMTNLPPAPLIVSVSGLDDARQIVNLPESGAFTVRLPAGGPHRIRAFLDLNRNERRDDWEPWLRDGLVARISGAGEPVHINLSIPMLGDPEDNFPKWMIEHYLEPLLKNGWVSPDFVLAMLDAASDSAAIPRLIAMATEAKQAEMSGGSVIGFTTFEQFLSETETGTTFRVRIHPPVEHPVTFSVRWAGGTFKPGEDFTMGDERYTIEGEQVATIPIQFVVDDQIEATEYAAFEIVDVDGIYLEPAEIVMLHVHDDALDTDADGLQDWWELKYFGDLSAGALEDPDQDGWNNLEEMRRGSDPLRAHVWDDDNLLQLELTTPTLRDANATRDPLPEELRVDLQRAVRLGAIYYEYRPDGRLSRIVQPGPYELRYDYRPDGILDTITSRGAYPSPVHRGTPVSVRQVIDNFNQVIGRLDSPLQYISGRVAPGSDVMVTINDVPCEVQPNGRFTAVVPFNNLTRPISAEVVVRAVRTSDQRVAEVRGIVPVDAAWLRYEYSATGRRTGAFAMDARHRAWEEFAEWRLRPMVQE